MSGVFSLAGNLILILSYGLCKYSLWCPLENSTRVPIKTKTPYLYNFPINQAIRAGKIIIILSLIHALELFNTVALIVFYVDDVCFTVHITNI